MCHLSFITSALICGVLASPALAAADAPLRNWTAPPYWSPPAASERVDRAWRDVARSSREVLALPSSPLPFVAVPPCRITDTRDGSYPPGYGPPSLVGGMAARTFVIPSGPCPGIPMTAGAYSLNFTVVAPGGTPPGGYLSAWPAGSVQPVVSTLNFTSGSILANAAIVPAGTGGGINLFVNFSTDLIIDINGYYAGTGLVTTLNTLSGDIALAGGTNVTITPSGNTLTVASPATLTGVTAGTGIAVSGGAPSPTVLIPPSGILADRIASGQVVRSVNNVKDGITISGTGGTTVSTVGSTITVASPPMSGLALNAYSARTLGSIVTDNWGCLDFDTSSYSQVRLDLPLPTGAVITGVNVRIVDVSPASSLNVQLRSVSFPAGTGVSFGDGVASGVLTSTDSIGSNVPLPGLMTSSPASATFSYYIFAEAPAHSGTLSFCGASVTFTLN